jgi:hypothetical protein
MAGCRREFAFVGRGKGKAGRAIDIDAGAESQSA